MSGGGLGAARDRTRYRRRPRLGSGQDAGGGRGRDWDEIPAGAEAEQAGSKSTQKKALYNILQQFWIFQILLSCNNQIAVLQKSRIMVNLNFSSIIFIVFRITFLSKMLSSSLTSESENPVTRLQDLNPLRNRNGKPRRILQAYFRSCVPTWIAF